MMEINNDILKEQLDGDRLHLREFLHKCGTNEIIRKYEQEIRKDSDDWLEDMYIEWCYSENPYMEDKYGALQFIKFIKNNK